jgi:photosystem II stability/assembly factor-like uncharacterized protein
MKSYRIFFCALALGQAVVQAAAPVVDPTLFSALRWRSIGPYRGGRCLAVAGSVQRPNEYFFGATGGGVWKTTDGGTNWKPVSDGFLGTSSVGAVAIAPSNPDIVVIGTGERDIRGDISHGDGAYRSLDAGKTWTSIGLGSTETISRIVIDPKDPDHIYVAALGHVYGKGLDRGVYRTLDGGKHWSQVLPGTMTAGAVDLCLDPSNPNVLLAATWEAWRTPYSLNSGGPGSGLWKSSDGGSTWVDLSRRPGLPTGTLGKIGISISPVDPKLYWAIVEANDGGIFRSDDAGATWTKVNDRRNWRQRAWYYSHVYADTKDKETFYVLNVGAAKSTNGGKSFTSLGTLHSDNHDLWIAPNDPNRLIESNDGGASVSTEGGKNWTTLTFPTGQFYHVATDNAFPYRILGCQQDNSSVRIASRTQGNGISATDWTSTAGGESGYLAADPKDPEIVYGGNYSGVLEMRNHRTNQSRSVDPWPENPMGHGAIDLDYRFQWTYPILFSLHDPNTMFTCSQFVMKSTNHGQSWQKISPDLTRNDPSTLQSSGGPITKDNTGVEYYGTVFTLGESPRKKGLLWAGSDDGLIYISQNGGGSWRNVTPKGMPKWGLVSMIEASPFADGTAYAAIDNHENDDLSPIIYRTRDLGETWTKCVSGLPTNSYVRVVREDRVRKGLLYAGTETGIWVSFDQGDHWQSLQLGLPNTPIHDLAWKENDLIAATHGRGFYILDDLTPLQQATSIPTTPKLYAPKPALAVQWGGSGSGRGANPPSGLILDYYLPKDAKEVTFEIRDASGELVKTSTGRTSAGAQRSATWLEYKSWHGFPGMILWSGFPGPIAAPPGKYTVTMVVDGVKTSQPFEWRKDPRGTSSDRDLVAQFVFLRAVAAELNQANDAVITIRGVRDGLDKALADATAKGVAAEFSARFETLKTSLTAIEEAIYQTKLKSGQDPLNYPIRLNDKLAGVFSNASGGDFRPTDQARVVFNKLAKLLGVQLALLKPLIEKELPKINADLKAKGIDAVKLPDLKVVAPEVRRRRSEEEEEPDEFGKEVEEN